MYRILCVCVIIASMLPANPRKEFLLIASLLSLHTLCYRLTMMLVPFSCAEEQNLFSLCKGVRCSSPCFCQILPNCSLIMDSSHIWCGLRKWINRKDILPMKYWICFFLSLSLPYDLSWDRDFLLMFQFMPLLDVTPVFVPSSIYCMYMFIYYIVCI